MTLAFCELGEESSVVSGLAEDDNPLVVLGSGPEKGHSTDVNLLDGSLDGDAGGGNGLDERVEVANNDGDLGNGVGEEISVIGRNVPGKDT